MNRQPIDQVVRREELQRVYPDEVSFWFDGMHRATVRRGGVIHEVAERELRPLLDRAEQILVSGT
jgi:hypothetical protein